SLCAAWRPCLFSLLSLFSFSGDMGDERAELLDLDFDDVAGFEPPLFLIGLAAGGDATRCAGAEDIAGLEPDARPMRDLLVDLVHHALRGRVLTDIAVDPALQREKLRIADLVGRHQIGAERREAGEILAQAADAAAIPRFAAIGIAVGDVVID